MRRRGWRLAHAALWLLTIGNAVFAAVLVAALVVPLPVRPAPPSVVVEYRDGRPAYMFLSPDDKWRLPVELDRLDPQLVRALVALEDKRFWDHAGVDPIAIVRAAGSNLIAGRRVSGGSTLSMQLARLLEPRARTVPNKLFDMFRALQLDLRLDKRAILEHYLARTPYGGNVEGVESAAWSYFGHAAQHLTPLEIATLLAVPQGPVRFAPRPQNAERLRARRDAILRKLIEAGVFGEVDAATALAEAAVTPAPAGTRRMPREAPHAAYMLRARHRGEVRIRSTLDAGAQALIERELVLRRPEMHRKQIHSAAVVVVDHQTRDVVALAGSLDFHDAAHGGQIAMFARARSPGSTLKPVAYALAIDRGLALPGYLMADVPVQYGTYRPKNFDGDWAGLVTLRDALSRSLNMQFIELLHQLGIEAFSAELARLGVSRGRLTPGVYGLSMIVGGIELTPLELAGIYATIAADGQHRPLRFADGDPQPAPVAVLGPGATFLTREALALKDRPDFPRRRALAGVPAEIHWKTGTSFGYRDAWAVGSGPRYTAVVWTGNVDLAPSMELVGSEAAGPLLFDVLEGLADRSRAPATPVAPAELVAVEVCAYSGHIAGDACLSRVTALAPVHSVPTAPCPYHQRFDVDPGTGRAVLPACRRPGVAYVPTPFVVLPSAVSAWLTSRNRSVPPPPVFDDACALDAAGAPPAILSPPEGQVVTLIPGMPASNQQIPLTAATRSATVTWFVDGELVGSGPASERVFWTPTLGTHVIVVRDAAGRKARRKLTVERAQ